LIIVTVVLVLVSLAAYGFVALMQAENKAAHIRGDQLQAENVAASGMELIGGLLDLPRSQRAAAGDLGNQPGLFQGQRVDGEATDARQGRFSIVCPHWDETGSASFRFGLEQESYKLNLATVLQWDQKSSGAGRAALMNLPGMTEGTADALLDWIDEDQTARPLGAESDYYLSLEPSYRAADTLPRSIEELLLVRGVTRELLLGLDLNANYRVDPFEAALASSQLQGQAASPALQTSRRVPWSRFLTVYSTERNESFDGRPRIFLNDSSLSSLHQRLLTALGPAWANFIIAYRQYGPSETSDRGEYPGQFAVDLSVPPKFKIESPLDLVGSTVKVPSSSSRSSSSGSSPSSSTSPSSPPSPRPLASPLETGAPGNPNDLLRLCDETTVDPQPIIRGRVNINGAPREVLSGVPGLDAAVIARIVSAKSTGQSDSRQRHAVWLLTEGFVDQPTMKRLLPSVTTGGDVMAAQIVAFYDQQSPWARVVAVFDGTRKPARRVYYKNLRNVGRGFSLGQLASAVDDRPFGPPSSVVPAPPPAGY
jgi:type II secretory pathway component PulK